MMKDANMIENWGPEFSSWTIQLSSKVALGLLISVTIFLAIGENKEDTQVNWTKPERGMAFIIARFGYAESTNIATEMTLIAAPIYEPESRPDKTQQWDPRFGFQTTRLTDMIGRESGRVADIVDGYLSRSESRPNKWIYEVTN